MVKIPPLFSLEWRKTKRRMIIISMIGRYGEGPF